MRQRARVLMGLEVGLAIAGLVWALPTAIRFVPHAPALFWALAALALLIDIPLFIDQQDRARVRTTLTVCVCFGILVLWGPAPAIIVQALAATLTAIGQRYQRFGALLFASRLVIAFAAVYALITVTGPPTTFRPGVAPDSTQVLWFVALAGVWLVVAHGLLLTVGAAVSGRRPSEVGQSGDDLSITVLSVLLVAPPIAILPGWLSLSVAAPLLIWNLAARARIRYDQQLLREPVTGCQSKHGLRAYLDVLTSWDRLRVQPFGVAVVDIGPALGLNQTFGPEIYEAVVVEAARRLKRAYGDRRVGRFSVESFAILTPDLPGADPVGMAEGMVRLLRPPVEVDGIAISLDPAVGVALSPEHGRDLDTLLVRAGLAVAQARRGDRSTAFYVPQAEAVTRSRFELLAELRAVLRDRERWAEIELLYQPQVDLATGRLSGVEALVRWTHPQWGPVPTDKLAETVEDNELVHLLTRHVLEAAATQVQRWNARGLRTRVAVNASVRDLHDPDFADEIETVIRSHGIGPEQLTLEVTERMVAASSARLARATERIRGLGVGLSVDDFGTGHTSIHELRDLPFSELKIDRSYVSAMPTSPSERAIVSGVHQIARSLGLAVVAEGVEDEPTATALAGLADIIGQGWHFGHPMSADGVYEQWRGRALEPEPVGAAPARPSVATDSGSAG